MILGIDISLLLPYEQERPLQKPTVNMKMIIAFAALVAIAVAAPQQKREEQVVIVKETPSDNIGVGGYNYGYELSNGQVHQESAQVINQGTENEALAVSGTFSWVDPATNVRYTVNYVADENGFRPTGDHIPTQA